MQQTRTLARLVEDLKTLSLADAGQLSLRRRPVDLAALAATVLDGFRARAVDAGIGLHLDPPPDGTGALELAADPERPTQVLATSSTTRCATPRRAAGSTSGSTGATARCASPSGTPGRA
ncbi:hypothetical protein [Geodermatophilus sp. SYSU D00710]